MIKPVVLNGSVITRLESKEELGYRAIFKCWWPLAMSWLLMGAELPLISAVMARLADPQAHLAAYGGVVFPIALIIEAPIIMLLSASTALAKDWDAYQKMRGFMLRWAAWLTLLHILVAFTPLYYWIARDLIGAPMEVLEPGKIGLRIMTPWTWAIAYRRFNQGVLIRYGHSNAVGWGTLIRLLANGSCLAIGFAKGLPGIVVATTAMVVGVLAEAFFIYYISRAVLAQLRTISPASEGLTSRRFLRFYFPLAMTSLVALLIMPILATSMSRMPHSLDSLAVWPALNGFVFMFKAIGLSYNEVVVALVDRKGGYAALRRFTNWIMLFTTGLMVVIVASPLAGVWFGGLTGLPDDLESLAVFALWWTLPMAAMSVWASWHTGILVHAGQTQPVNESVILSLLVCVTIQVVGVWTQTLPGVYVAVFGWTAGQVLQSLWLSIRSRRLRGRLRLSQQPNLERV